MGEIKQTNFRVDQEKADAFRAYCEANDINQATGFERMLEALELQQAKVAIPSRETEISEFERCLRHLQGAYLNSLELNEQAEARIREEFARQLDAKDRTIANNQDQIDALKAEKAALAADAAKAHALQADLEAVTEQARQDRNNAADRLAEKDRLITTLDSRVAMLEIQAAGYDDLRSERDTLANQLRDANQALKDQGKDHQIELERATRAAEKAQIDAVAAAKAEGEEVAAELRKQLQEAQIDAARALQEAEKAAHKADMEFATEIRRLEQENARLQVELAALRAKQKED